MRRSFVLFGMLAGLAAGTTAVLQSVDAPAVLIYTCFATLFGLFPVIQQWLERRSKTTSQAIVDLVERRIYSNPIVVCLNIVCFLMGISFAMGAFAGFFTWVSFELTKMRTPAHELPDFAQISEHTRFVGLCMSLTIQALLMVPVAKWVAHRIKRNSFLWVAGAIIVHEIVNVVLKSAYPLLTNQQAHPWTLVYLLGWATGVFLVNAPRLLGAAIGCWFARQTQDSYQLRRLLPLLSPANRSALLDLVKDLPGVSARPE